MPFHTIQRFCSNRQVKIGLPFIFGFFLILKKVLCIGFVLLRSSHFYIGTVPLKFTV